MRLLREERVEVDLVLRGQRKARWIHVAIDIVGLYAVATFGDRELEPAN